MKKCLAVILVLVAIFAGALYFAQRLVARTPVYKVYKIYTVMNNVDKTASDLQLTPEQKAILAEIRRMLLEQGEALNDGGGDIVEAFVDELKKEQFNQPKMNSLVGKLLRRVQGIMPELFEKVAELHATLTPVQKNKIIALLEGNM